MGREEGPHLGAAVGLQSIPEQDDRPAHMTSQMSKEADQVRRVDRPGEGLQVQVRAHQVAARRGSVRQGTDR